MPNVPPPTLPAKYIPSEHEASIRANWDSAKAFHADPGKVLSGEKPPYCIFIPPPNVTARLHLGHALNNTLQDILSRVHRMKGYEVLWMPGTDHAGIATQTVVEQRIFKEEGKRRADFEREEFIARVQTWKDEYEAAITDQLKTIGCSCDWERQRFTMDEICARAVREAFFILFRDGLIYRGKRLVNWDPISQTALADDEVEMEEVDGFFYYLRYPVRRPNTDTIARLSGGLSPTLCLRLSDTLPVTWSELASRGYPGADRHPADENAWVTVATTRPETYLGDTAVAMNPKDPRAVALEGFYCELPFLDRAVPIVKDDYVVMPAADPKAEGVDPKARFATGFLKVTPAHDPNDYDIGRRHDLGIINVMAPDASISDKHGWTDVGDAHLFVGLTREAAREKVNAEFKARGLLEKITPYRHSVGHSYRSHVPIEPYLSDQWYCKVTDDRMKGAALRALDQSSNEQSTTTLKFFPERYSKMYQSWHENLRDWCISRQLWWGHRIPVWSGNVAQLDDLARIDHSKIAFGIPFTHVIKNQTVSVILVPDASSAIAYVCVPPHALSIGVLLEGVGFSQDPDVLDTWFSSALWPISTLGWPEPPAEMKGLLEAFNPSSVLATAREIITLWVSRMTMFNRYLLPEGWPQGELTTPGQGNGPVPFHHVYINAVVQDGHGQRMSKSLGNGVDPLDIVHSHGADALRFVLTQIATAAQDVRMPVDLLCPHCAHAFEPAWITSPAGYKVAAPQQTCPKCKKPSVSGYGVATGTLKPTADMPQARNSSTKFDAGRNFCSKLFNATKFTLMNLEAAAGSTSSSPSLSPAKLSLPDRWMLSRLARTVHAIDEALSEYQFARYAELMYDLFWRDFCDWYLESIKPTIKSDAAQQAVLHRTLDSILRLLHPMCPYITEVLHDHVRPGHAKHGTILGLTLGDSELLCLAPWPKVDRTLIDDGSEADFARMQSLVEQIRQVRSAKGVPPGRKVHLHADQETLAAIRGWGGVVESLGGIEALHEGSAPAGAAPFLFEGRESALANLADEADPASERQRLTESLAKLDKDISVIESRLNNPGYAAKAPPKLVQETKDQLAQKQAEREATHVRLKELA